MRRMSNAFDNIKKSSLKNGRILINYTLFKILDSESKGTSGDSGIDSDLKKQ
jgi:hypothetical protein